MGLEVVEDDLAHLAALELDDDPHTVLVGLIAQAIRRNAIELLLAHQLRDALDQACLVDLVGQLGEDDRLALLADLLDVRLRARDDSAAPGRVGGVRAGTPHDDPAGREIGRRDMVH